MLDSRLSYFRVSYRAEDGREPTIEPNEQKAIDIAELWPLRYLPAKHVELLAKD
jgi:hypothetical protein